MAGSADLRDYWKKRVVEVRGQFSPYPGSEQVFMLIRQKIGCCAADAVQLNVPIFARERIVAFKHTDWVKVTGTIDFRERNGSYFTVLLVSSASDVVACPPDPNPYIK